MFGKNILGENIFGKNIFSKIFFSDHSPHLTALQITLPPLSSPSVIFEVECDTTNETNEGLTDRTEQWLFLLYYYEFRATRSCEDPNRGL